MTKSQASIYAEKILQLIFHDECLIDGDIGDSLTGEDWGRLHENVCLFLISYFDVCLAIKSQFDAFHCIKKDLNDYNLKYNTHHYLGG